MSFEQTPVYALIHGPKYIGFRLRCEILAEERWVTEDRLDELMAEAKALDGCEAVILRLMGYLAHEFTPEETPKGTVYRNNNPICPNRTKEVSIE